jgi:hypothetical protein
MGVQQRAEGRQLDGRQAHQLRRVGDLAQHRRQGTVQCQRRVAVGAHEGVGHPVKEVLRPRGDRVEQLVDLAG